MEFHSKLELRFNLTAYIHIKFQLSTATCRYLILAGNRTYTEKIAIKLLSIFPIKLTFNSNVRLYCKIITFSGKTVVKIRIKTDFRTIGNENIDGLLFQFKIK